MRADRQTDTLIAILYNPAGSEVQAHCKCLVQASNILCAKLNSLLRGTKLSRTLHKQHSLLVMPIWEID